LLKNPDIGENMVEQKNKIPLKLNPDIKQIYATGAFGGFTPYDCRIVLFNDSTIPTDESNENFQVARIADYEIIMPHRTVKELYNWLGKLINEFEDVKGSNKQFRSNLKERKD